MDFAIKNHVINRLLIILLLFLFNLWGGNLNNHSVKIVKDFTIEQNLKSPLRITGDASGHIYVTTGASYIGKLDTAGHFLGKIKTPGKPLALAVNENMLYVSIRGTNQILQMDTSGTPVEFFGNVALASDMAIDGDGRLFVVDSKRRQIVVFSAQNKRLFSFGSDVLVLPTGITIDEKHKHVLVTEHGGLAPPDSSLPFAAVHVFDLQGQWLEYYGHYGGEADCFVRMQGLDTDILGRMFIADSYQGVIKILDKTGTYLTALGQFGFANGELAQPMDVFVDAHNHLWVAGYNNDAIVRFSIKGLPVPIDQQNPAQLPAENRLLQNYPNPFNGTTVIPFTLSEDADVTINIYNSAGQRIRNVRLGRCAKGSYLTKGKAYFWDGKNEKGLEVASGVYYYELHLRNFRTVKRMLLIK